ncbi:MAG: MarR family winged helix-turn-helix transcriptional regulator [Devosia sp.]
MPLDENFRPELIDHVGWRLWRLARQWKAEFEGEMQRRGYPWVAEARGGVIGHLRPGGRPQSELAGLLGVSKQAVQQFVDELVREGAVERVVDPRDARGRIVQLTRRGTAFLAEGNAVKRQIEARYAGRIGRARLDALNRALDDLAEE